MKQGDEFRMSTVMADLIPRLLVREGLTLVTRWSLVALVLAAVTAAPQSGTADEISSEAGHISPALGGTRTIAVIDQTDIELSGQKNVSDLLLSRAGYNSFSLRRPFLLGSGRVAFLVDGRISDSTINLDTLPISAIERIEILSGSTAALHGGYATGGAINIVLKRDHEGFEVGGSAARPSRRGGDSGHGNALWGGAVGRGHMTAGVDVFRRQEIRDADRDYSRASWIPDGSFAEAMGVSTGGNTVFIDNDPTIARSLGDCEGSAYVSGLTNPQNISGTGCGFAYADIAWNIGRDRFERESLFLNLDYPLGEDMGMYFDVRAARGDTASRFAPSVGTFEFTPSAALRTELLLDPDISTLPDTLDVAHRFVGHGNRDSHTGLEEYDLSLGLQGRFAGGIGYDTHLRYYRYDAVETGETFVSESLIKSAIADGTYNLENPLSTDPAHLSAIRETGLRLTRKVVTDHKTARASLDGTAFTLGGGDVRWATGTEVAFSDRRDIYDYRDSDSVSHEAHDVLGSGGNSAAGERRRRSMFTEAFLPLHSDWDLILAGRRDEYDDVDATFSHQVASRYRLNEVLDFRGSWNGGGQVPGIYSLYQRAALSYPYICDRSRVNELGSCDRYQVELESAGNPELKPERAESFSLGAVADLHPWSLSMDWFRIGLYDQPTRLSGQSIVNLESVGRLPSVAKIIRAGDRIDRIESARVNSGETDAEGLDFRARANWKTGWADLVFDARWLRVTDYEYRVFGEIQPGDYSRDSIHTSLRASRGGVTANWNIHAVSGYQNVLETGSYEKWVGHDITLHWNNAFDVKELSLAGGILNVGDRGPSTDPTNPDAPDVRLDSALGRTLFLTAKFSFGS